MPIYRITAPNGQTYRIEGPPGASDADVADAVLAQYPEAGKPPVPPPERTFLGGAKELVKGLVPGAVGLVESAATGASALLPEDMEKAAREKIASVAASAKEPFKAAAGYEESIPRKLSEAIGSTAPFLLAGPLGLAGRAAAVGLGVGAGAGEARTRAEAEGATAEQRSKATAYGILPGAAEAFAPFRILSRIPDAATASAVQMIKRAFAAGGEEAAQEVASGLAQNMIAKGIYKPEQELIEGLGEQAAYGGATGAIIQGLMDVALGRRAKGAAPAPSTRAEPGPQVAPEAPQGTQGTLFAEEKPPAKAPVTTTPTAETYAELIAERDRLRAEPVSPETRAQLDAINTQLAGDKTGAQLGLGLDFERDYADIVKERETLKQQPQTPEVKARITELNDQVASLHEMEVARIRAEKAEEDTARAEFPGLAETAPITPRTQMDLFGEAEAPTPAAQQAAEEIPEPTKREPKGGYQYKLPLRTVPEGKEAKRDLPIPARPDEITMQDLEDIGVPLRTSQKWLEQNVVGKTPAEIQVLVANNPNLILRKGSRAEILKYLTAPVPEGFKEEPSVAPITQTNKPKPVNQPRRSQPSVGVSGQPASADVVQPGTGVPTTAGAPATPDGRGLAPAGQPAGTGTTPQGTQPTAVRTSDQVMDEMRALREEQEALLTKAGKRPAVKSKARARWDDITELLRQKKKEWDALDSAERKAKNAPTTTATPVAPVTPAVSTEKPTVAAKPASKAAPAKKVEAPAPAKPAEVVETETVDEEAARKAEAEDVKRRLEEVERKLQERSAPKAAPAPAPKAEKAEPKEIPEKLREPVGTTEYGAKEGEKEILRGPQGLLFPMSKREELEYAARKEEENAKKDDVVDAPKVDTSQMDLVFPETIVKAINGKTILEAANWGAQNFPDADQRMIAMRVAATLRELQSLGVTMGPLKVTDEDKSLASGAKGVAIMTRGANNTPSSIRITVNHYSNGDQSGVDPEGVLHELIHAATMGATQIGNKKAAANTRVGKTVGELYDVVNAVFAHVDAKHAKGETLNDVEKKLRTPYMRDVDEVLAWTMTNRDMQAYMETVPYKNSNLWDKFVESVRKVLGLTPKADTALSEILRVGGELTSMTAADLKEASTATGMQFSKSYTAQDVVDSMGPLTPTDKRGLKDMIVGVEKEGDPTKGVKFRVAAVDSAAAIEEKFSRTFNGAVRDNMGKINPMGLYRQAQDYSKILLEYFQKGALTKDKETGLYRAIGAADGAPSDVFPMIYAWGEKTGRTKEQAEQFASRVLEAKRLDEVLKVNPDFPKHIQDRERAILVAEYNSDPAFAKMNAAMDKPRLALIDKMVDVGRLSKEKAEEWKSVVGYVPFDRIDDFSEKFSMTKKTTGRSPLALTKDPELVGSFKRPVGNVFENYLNTMGWMVGQVMNNDARVQTLRGLEDLGFTSKASRVPGTEGKTAKAFIKGEPMYWELPSRYDVAAFQDLNPPKMAFMRTLGAFSNILRKSVTILPPFALKQVTDDVQRAMLTSGVKNPGALLRMSLANFGKLAVAELRGIQHPIVKEFGALGLTGEYDFQQGKPAVSLLQDLGYRQREVAGSKTLGTILHRLDGITRASDLAVRKAIYEQTLKESNNDVLLAQTRAREFINFRRRGASEIIAVATATIPFFNAYAQGMDVLYRAASGKDSSSSIGRAQARQLFWSRAGTVAALSTMYALMAGDDEDYQDMDLRTRNGNWILPGGYKIPVPGELGAIFKVIPETVVEYLRRSGTPEEQTALEAIRASAKYMAEQYIERTVPIPQAAKPLIEAWTNYSFFTGRELEGIYQKQQDPSMRTTSKTSELAQAISNFSRDVIGVDAVSPIQIDNMLSGYFGSTAALVTMMTDSLLNPSRIDRPLHKYALLSNYLYDPVGTRSLTEFYDEREKVGKANNTLRQLMKTDIARAEAYAEAHQPELMLESAINSTLEQLERTRAYRKFLNSPDGAAEMSKADREKELEEIKKMEVEFTRWLREAKTEIRKVQ